MEQTSQLRLIHIIAIAHGKAHAGEGHAQRMLVALGCQLALESAAQHHNLCALIIHYTHSSLPGQPLSLNKGPGL